MRHSHPELAFVLIWFGSCAPQSLAEAAPTEALAALRAPLEAALAAGPQDEDRPRACAAAEVVSGLLASGALFLDTGALSSQAYHTLAFPALLVHLTQTQACFYDVFMLSPAGASSAHVDMLSELLSTGLARILFAFMCRSIHAQQRRCLGLQVVSAKSHLV